ncbi:MAG: M15 family metallopeptidase [Erysipelotrichaceae bacterium]|nr:M15 family metallopeptidase [Erysipelotrichaceae bacterium]
MFGRRKHTYTYSTIQPNRGRTRMSRSYGYGYSPYKSDLKKKILKIVLAVVLVIGVVVGFNFSRIRLAIKGYSIGEQSQILKLGKSNVAELLKEDKLDHITDWISLSDKVSYYNEYEQYLTLHDDLQFTNVISEINTIYDEQVKALNDLGYSDEVLWELLKTQDAEDLSTLINNKVAYDDFKVFMEVDGYSAANVVKYKSYFDKTKSASYAVLAAEYPMIISSNKFKTSYTITEPAKETVLVKKGFYLPADYEPDDLVEPVKGGIQAAPDCDESKLRQAAMDALNEMYKDAKTEGLTLVINDAYRSYKRQQSTYKTFEKNFGGQYAAEHVALPGASDHQTGLGVDLTSKSVVKGQRLVFSDTEEYKWAVKHCYDYGFILRYPPNTSKITGITSEAWHFRYVGKKAAKMIGEHQWTLEEYCLYTGKLPKMKVKES